MAPAQRFKSGGEWKTITSKDLCDRVFHLALFLESRGFKSQDIGVIHSYNCPQWVQMDLAPLLLCGRSAGLYPNSTRQDVHYIINHTETRFLSVQNAEYYKKIVGPNQEQPLSDRVELIVVFEGDAGFHPKAVRYEEALAEGRKLARGKSIEDYLKRINPQDGAFLIYTSGTTGSPKGAILSHDNVVFVSDTVSDVIGIPRKGQSMFSFLPLCHVAEKIQNIGVGITCRCEVFYCSKFENVAQELPEAQPTILLCVPRVWEKMMDGVQARLAQATGLKKRMADWAFGVGRRMALARYGHAPKGLSDVLQHELADRLVLSKVRKALGMGRLQYAASGTAALGVHITEWFRSLGVDILEEFGQTESTAVVTFNQPGVEGLGTVGVAIPNTEMKIAEDGEILTRGRHVFKGYFKNEQATAETIRDGWLHTGDIGELNEKKQLTIKGRKKEILKTSGGKMIAPLPIEETLKASPIISQVCMVGDGRKFLSALITLSEEAIKNFHINGSLPADGVVQDERVIAEVKKVVESVNQTLSSYSQIKTFSVLGREFSIDRGEMTPTLKVKRAVVEKNYKDVIERMYPN